MLKNQGIRERETWIFLLHPKGKIKKILGEYPKQIFSFIYK